MVVVSIIWLLCVLTVLCVDVSDVKRGVCAYSCDLIWLDLLMSHHVQWFHWKRIRFMIFMYYFPSCVSMVSYFMLMAS